MALNLLPPQQRLDRSIAIVEDADWCCWDAVAAFKKNTRLFVKDDVVFCRFNNGQGLRCIVCGYSSKFGKMYGQIYAAYARDKPRKYGRWHDYSNHPTIQFLIPLGELSLDSVSVFPEVRVLLLQRYAQRFPQSR